MAGAAGFEPTHGRIKTCCLTAWRRPYLCYCLLSLQGPWGDLCKNARKFINFFVVCEVTNA
ncbi:hypothetical protein EMIT0196P_30034 [Pseudomonas chlororaphis]